MIGSVPIRTCLTLLISIIHYAVIREAIVMKEDGITFKGYHQSAIPLLHLSQLFRQIDEIFALDINMELLEANNICRHFTLLVVTFTISTSDTVPRE